jgi:hypothetical protein
VFSSDLIDWSPRTPHVLFKQLLPVGYHVKPGVVLPPPPKHTAWSYGGSVTFDEIILDGSEQAITTERLCEHIRAKGYQLSWAEGDPAGRGVEATSGVDQVAIARQVLGLNFKFPPHNLRNISDGIQHVKALLEPVQGPPRLYFARKLAENRSPRGVWNALRGYSYPRAKDGKPLGESPEKDGITDHASDCERYDAVINFPIARLGGRVRSIA